jgi:hypothetical protein
VVGGCVVEGVASALVAEVAVASTVPMLALLSAAKWDGGLPHVSSRPERQVRAITVRR